MQPCPVCGQSGAPSGISPNGYPLLACVSCGHRYAPGAFGVQVSYEEVWATVEYAEKRAQLAGVDPSVLGRHPTYAPFFTRLGASRGRSLLDAGCGSGRFCRAAQAAGFDVSGIDVSGRAIKAARAQGFSSVRATTLDAVAAQGERFDVVTAFEVLEHLEDAPAFLAAAREVLARGGAFFCTVPNGECAAVLASPAPDHQPPVHRHFFSGRSLLLAALKAGFAGAVVGRIRTDYLRPGAVAGMRWLARRALGRPNQPLGLWLHASRGD